MCGIAGVFNYRSDAPADRFAVRRMAASIAHRGPDADGFHFDGSVALAHRRLAILDLSERGRQPMSTPDGRFTLVFNGEIYNYIELRNALRRDGWTFRTETDTEVLLALLARYGPAALSRLNGMFAFALWDQQRRELFIARDRVGIKPLYYAETAQGFVFASEAKALFEYPGVACEVDVPQIQSFMTFGYVPGTSTLFRGVRKLLPGHSVTITNRGPRFDEYWDVRYAPDTARSVPETAAALHDLLLDAMRIHLRSDVPLGVFLSGGLDSSAVVSLLREAGIDRIRTFSVAYESGPQYDESPYAKLVSDHFRTTHHVLYVQPDRFAGFIPEYVWYMDEPVAEGPALSLYFISRELRQHVTVALSGEGADELFGGYQIYRYMLWLDRYRRFPPALRDRILHPLLRRVPHDKVRKYADLATLPLEQRYLGVRLRERAPAASLYSDAMQEHAGATSTPLTAYYGRCKDADPLSRMLYVDLKAWLVDDLLVKADKMTMANSVELRVPFLDYRVVEFAATIPSKLKLRHGDVKWILKKAMAPQLPDRIVQRPKVGFPTPLAPMFRRDLIGYVKDLLLSPTFRDRGYFNADAISRLITEHASGVHDHHNLLWQLIVLEEWHRAFIDERRRPDIRPTAEIRGA